MSFRIRRAAGRGAALRLMALLLVAPFARADGDVEMDRQRVELPVPPSDKVAPRGIDGEIVLRDIPGEVLPPQPDALSCVTPTTTGALVAIHPFYDVMLGCDNGSFSARTGASHPVTALALGFAQNVIYGGAGAAPRTSDVTWRFHDQALSYLNPTGGSACVFDPPDTAAEPNSVGVEEEWLVTPAPGITCVLREEIVAFGSTAENSGVRLTMSTTNVPFSTSDVNVGVRWQIDYQNAIDDGPWLATVTCNPSRILGEWSLEHEFVRNQIRDFYRIRNNQGFPTFSNITSTTPLLGIPDTDVPDRLVFGRWQAMNDSAWGYRAVENGCCPDDDSAVLWYHGYLPADGDIIPPGETVRHSVVIFSSAENIDCGAFTPGCDPDIITPPTDQRICLGDSATLDASGITLNRCGGTVVYLWTDGPNSWLGPAITVTPTRTTSYHVRVWCSTEPDCVGDVSVTVTVDTPPVITTPPADQRICLGDSALLDARGITSPGCGGSMVYQWTDGPNIWMRPAISVTPTQTTTYRVRAWCSSSPDCIADVGATITVDAPPRFQPPVITDPDACNPGIIVTWDAAAFYGPSGRGVYNVYRSDVSCVDAAAGRPYFTGLTTTRVVDDSTIPGTTYYYVVEAEDDQSGTACGPPGPWNGGGVTRLCSLPTMDILDDIMPGGVGPVLRVRHAGDAVTVEWPGVRALLPFEHVHLLKAWSDPEGMFRRINPEADVSRAFTETDSSTAFQFYDLRVANKCEGQAGPDYPAGWDP